MINCERVCVCADSTLLPKRAGHKCVGGSKTDIVQNVAVSMLHGEFRVGGQ